MPTRTPTAATVAPPRVTWISGTAPSAGERLSAPGGRAGRDRPLLRLRRTPGLPVAAEACHECTRSLRVDAPTHVEGLGLEPRAAILDGFVEAVQGVVIRLLVRPLQQHREVVVV